MYVPKIRRDLLYTLAPHYGFSDWLLLADHIGENPSPREKKRVVEHADEIAFSLTFDPSLSGIDREALLRLQQFAEAPDTDAPSE